MSMDDGNGTRRPEPLVGTAKRTGRKGRARAEQAAPPRRRRSRASHNPVVLVLNLMLSAAVIVVLGSAAAIYLGREAFYDTGPHGEDRVVLIPRGSGVDDIAISLQDNGVIGNGWLFRAAAFITDDAPRFKAGEYLIPAGASMADVMRILVEGRSILHPITIPEGLTSAQVVAVLKESPVLSGPIDAIPPEGSLLPETYRVERGTSRQAIIDRMQAEQRELLEEVWANRDPDLPVDDPLELVTLASIVEKETGQREERDRVAAVFVNRLQRGMKLQSDPTILYGLYGGEAWSQERTIYRSDIERATPYNTYVIPALPPGPIANPGRAALEAAARPAETDELFFVADGTGGHAFAETYAEHQQNVARWREIERGRSEAPRSN